MPYIQVLTFQIRETRTYTRGFGLVSTIPHMVSGLVLPLSKSRTLAPLQNMMDLPSVHENLLQEINCKGLKHE